MHGFEVDLQTLELDQDASGEEIKQAYKDLVMVWHPDRFSHNPRLQHKAQEKLKRFNQAYEHLKDWQPNHSASEAAVHPSKSSPSPCVRRKSPASPKRSHQRWSAGHPPSRPVHSHSSHFGVDTPCISLADAEFILQHYHFVALNRVSQSLRQFQGGPFVLAVCDTPPEVMISVPCDSLQMFDRILLSIPCKSTGHFIQQDAEHLLHLLYAQE